MEPPNDEPNLIYKVLAYDPKEMARRGRKGAASKNASHDGAESTNEARMKFLERFENEPNPEAARSEYFKALAAKSVAKRRASHT